ncbi:MAG: NUDIX hydrolase [Leptolyngbya sp.]|nr:NUDIX hydrolase [Leptolyngbya sp.]
MVGRVWRPVRVLLGLLLRRPILGTSIIAHLADGRVVLVRRRDNGLWSLPGGIVDWGEDIATAARRELAEETGLTLTALGPLVGIYSAPDRDPRFHSVCVAVVAEVTGTPHISDQAEILEVGHFQRDELLRLPLSHDHARQIEDFLAGRTVLA